MYKNKKILAIVPARGGSKGVKNKNLKKINGFYLVDYLSNTLKKTPEIDLIIASSDNEKIINLYKKKGINSFFRRPKKLSGDKVGDHPVLKHALTKIENTLNIKFDIIIMLQVTSPLRRSKHIKQAIQKLVDNKLDALWSISEVDKKYSPLKQLKLHKNYLRYDNPVGSKIIRRQQLNKTYIRNGSVYAFTRKTILSDTLLPKKTGYLLIKEKQISIDNHLDIVSLKKILKIEK